MYISFLALPLMKYALFASLDEINSIFGVPNFYLGPDLHPYFVYASSKGSGESFGKYAHLPELLLLADDISTEIACIGPHENDHYFMGLPQVLI